MENKNKLPTLAELHKDPAKAFETDKLNLLLNQPPHEDWIKKHPLAKVKNDQGKEVAARYMPIDKIEFLLTRIFGQWKVEILREGVMFQSVYVTIRLHYFHPLNLEWSFQDGIGAAPVQTDSGFSAADLSHIKSHAVQIGLPAATSYAIKDAAEHLGTLFGRDLNRKDLIQFAGAYKEPVQQEKQEVQSEAFKGYQDLEL